MTDHEIMCPYVLFRCSKKTGKVDTTMTALGRAMLEMWALQNTTKTKQCFVINGVTGRIVYATQGTANGFPKVKKGTDEKELPLCTDIGIEMDDIHAIVREDGRFAEYID